MSGVLIQDVRRDACSVFGQYRTPNMTERPERTEVPGYTMDRTMRIRISDFLAPGKPPVIS
jgi:hypothetical protein